MRAVNRWVACPFEWVSPASWVSGMVVGPPALLYVLCTELLLGHLPPRRTCTLQNLIFTRHSTLQIFVW